MSNKPEVTVWAPSPLTRIGVGGELGTVPGHPFLSPSHCRLSYPGSPHNAT